MSIHEKLFGLRLKELKKEISGCTFLAPYKTKDGEIKVKANFSNGNAVLITIGDINTLTKADYDEIVKILKSNGHVEADL
jgi:hypothetical protein